LGLGPAARIAEVGNRDADAVADCRTEAQRLLQRSIYPAASRLNERGADAAIEPTC
jgi:hypothetical protein